MATPEVVVPFDPRIPPLSAVKGMLLHSSLDALRALGHFPRYAQALGPEHLAELCAYLGNTWVPVAAMHTHYATCDGLELSAPELDAMGRWVADRLQQRMLATLTSAARSAGVDVWTMLGPVMRMAGRVFQDSQAVVVKVGPKDVETTIHGNPLFDYKYFRVAYCGTVRGMLGLIGARSSHVKILYHRREPAEIRVLMSWV